MTLQSQKSASMQLRTSYQKFFEKRGPNQKLQPRPRGRAKHGLEEDLSGVRLVQLGGLPGRGSGNIGVDGGVPRAVYHRLGLLESRGFLDLSEARSRLYQSRSLQVKTHPTPFVKIYKIMCIIIVCYSFFYFDECETFCNISAKSSRTLSIFSGVDIIL